MRAREPDHVGDVDRDGVAIHYEVFGTGATTVVLMGTFPVVDGRQWKAQVPYLARHFRVITIDARGNGGSGRPAGPDAYSDEINAADAAAVLDATDTESAFLVALCSGIKWSILLAHNNPGRVRGLVAIAPGVHPLAPQPNPLDPVDAPRWQGDFAGWTEYHTERLTPEPYSSKLYDDLVELDDADRRGHADLAHPRAAAADRGSRGARPVRIAGLPGARHPRHRRSLPAAGAGPSLRCAQQAAACSCSKAPATSRTAGTPSWSMS